MIVQCPYCSTRYQLDDERFNAPNPMLKCSRCRHVFPAPGSKKSAPAKTKKTTPPEDESLTLPFERESWKDEAEPPPRGGDEREGFVLGTGEEIEEAADDQAGRAEGEVEAGEELVHHEEPAEPELPDLTFEEAPEMSFADDDEIAPPPTPRRRDRYVVRGILIGLALIVAAYGFLTHALFTNPALAKRLLGPLPLIGTLASDRLLARDVTLVNVRGGFQRIKDDKEVFVIAGEAMSAAPMMLRDVEVQGKLLGAGGELLAEKTIFCGNVVSAKILESLTPREVSVLQTMAPPKEFGIKPGESAAFVIVFMEPPKGAADFSVQAVGAAPQA
jgi:predicted Zn finger-like uncharacterized protein